MLWKVSYAFEREPEVDQLAIEAPSREAAVAIALKILDAWVAGKDNDLYQARAVQYAKDTWISQICSVSDKAVFPHYQAFRKDANGQVERYWLDEDETERQLADGRVSGSSPVQ